MSQDSFRVKKSLTLVPVSARPSSPSNGEIIYNSTANNFEKYINGAWVADMLNPMTTAGDLIYGGTSGVPTRLAVGTASQVLGGGATPTWVTPSSVASASSIVVRNSQAGFGIRSISPSVNTTVTTGGTTTLTSGSNATQIFTGSTTQTVTMPDVTTLAVAGQQYYFKNASTGVVTVNSQSGALLVAMAAGSSMLLTCISLGVNTAAGWSVSYSIDGTTAALNPMTTGGDIVYGGASGVPTRLANGSVGQVLTSAGSTSAPTWSNLPTPTIQKFTSSSGTYTTPANVRYIRVRMVGGGGGGAGGGTTYGAGGDGGGTTFGTTLLVAGGGGGSAGSNGGASGTASLGTGPIGLALPGGRGGTGSSNSAATAYPAGGDGGPSFFSGNGTGGRFGAGGTGQTNTGGGGGGGSGSNAATHNGGSGGGGGGYVDAIINAPSSTYSYAVGAAGTAGAAGTSGNAGAAGGSGFIIVEEYY